MTYLFLLLINYMSGMPLHAIHVSVCDIDYDVKKQQLEISHRIFLDDLEVTLSSWSGEPVDVMNPSDPKELSRMIGRYLDEKTSYTLNGKLATAKYLGSEMEEAVMYCYQVITNVKKIKKLKVRNTALIESFGDQSNVVHIKIQEVSKSLKLNASEIWGEIVIE